mgnify:FL=1
MKKGQLLTLGLAGILAVGAGWGVMNIANTKPKEVTTEVKVVASS